MKSSNTGTDAVGLVVGMDNKNPEIVNLLAEMAERKVPWQFGARTVRKEVFVPLLEKIAELKTMPGTLL